MWQTIALVIAVLLTVSGILKSILKSILILIRTVSRLNLELVKMKKKSSVKDNG